MLNIVSEDFTDLPFIENSANQQPLTGEVIPYSGDRKWKAEDIVYLTGDAEETMEEFDPSKLYVIGGIVDHNAFKNFTLAYAKSKGIKV